MNVTCPAFLFRWQAAAGDRYAQPRVGRGSVTAPLAELADDALMARVGDGDREAFAMLVRRYCARVIAYASKVTGSTRLGEEIAQETWLAVWANRARYEGSGRFLVFVLTIARNKARNAVAKTAREDPLEPERDSNPPPGLPQTLDASALAHLVAAETSDEVRRGLERIAPKLKEALMLRFADELSYEEMAQILGASESTLRSRVFHGLRALALELTTGGAP